MEGQLKFLNDVSLYPAACPYIPRHVLHAYLGYAEPLSMHTHFGHAIKEYQDMTHRFSQKWQLRVCKWTFYGVQNVIFEENPHENERIGVFLWCAISYIAHAKHGYTGGWLMLWHDMSTPSYDNCNRAIDMVAVDAQRRVAIIVTSPLPDIYSHCQRHGIQVRLEVWWKLGLKVSGWRLRLVLYFPDLSRSTSSQIFCRRSLNISWLVLFLILEPLVVILKTTLDPQHMLLGWLLTFQLSATRSTLFWHRYLDK